MIAIINEQSKLTASRKSRTHSKTLSSQDFIRGVMVDAAVAKRWIADALSVITARAVPAGAALGPCAGAHSLAFIAWKCADRRTTACALRMDPSASSECLQMIQSARNTEEQNLEVYMKDGNIFFRAIKDIPENTELFAWYGRDLAKLLGLSTEQKNTKGFTCPECKQTFLFEFPLLAHQRFFCKPTSFLKKLTVPEIPPLSSKPTTNFHNLARELENCRKNRPADAKSTKRRRSLESDTAESDSEQASFGVEKDSVKRVCVFGVNGHSSSPSSKTSFSEGPNFQLSPSHHHDNHTESQDLKSSTKTTKSAFKKESHDVLGGKTRTSAFTPPPRFTSHIQLMPSSFPSNLIPTSVLPGILPLNLQRSAILYKDVPKQLALLPGANVWPKTSRLQQARVAPLQSLLPPSLSSLGLPAQNWCAKCNISFHMTSDLVQHMRSHHKRALSDERQPRRREDRLKCPICREAFRERHHLSRHMTSHT